MVILDHCFFKKLKKISISEILKSNFGGYHHSFHFFPPPYYIRFLSLLTTTSLRQFFTKSKFQKIDPKNAQAGVEERGFREAKTGLRSGMALRGMNGYSDTQSYAPS
ncbi:hypothetical protein AB7D55_002205 [Vibrio mimicus]